MAVRIFSISRLWAALVLLLIGSGCSVDNAKRHYALAEKLWTDGKYAAAVSEFEKVSQRDPTGKLGTQALLRGATTQELFLKQYAEAVQKLKRYTEISHDDASVWAARKQIGEILFNKTEQYDQALRWYQNLLQLQPKAEEVPEFTYRVARCQFYLGKFEDALASYLLIIKANPQTQLAERATFEIAQTHLAQGEQAGTARTAQDYFKNALAAYQDFLKKFPKSSLAPEAEFGIASCQEATDQLDAAFQSYQALLDTYPSRKVIEIKLERIRERKTQRSH